MSQMPEPSKTSELLVEHYQKTYELTYEMWRERNRLFPTLAAVIGGAMILAFHVPQAESLFAAILGSLLRLDTTGQQAIQQGLSYQILQTVLMVVVFHLVLDLYRHNQDITRNYKYLAGMEAEIRQTMGFGADRVAFSREDVFYRSHKAALLGGVRFAYTLVLGVMLALFIYARVSDDIRQAAVLFAIVDGIVALATAAFFIDYAFPGLLNRKKKAT